MYLQFSTFEWREAKPRTSRIGFVQSFDSLPADVHEPPSPFSTRSPPSTLRFWPHFLFQTPRLRGSLLVLLGIGTLGRRVAPHSVQYTISQVCLASCQPGMSPQSASRGPVERVYVHVPRLWERRCPQRTAGGLGRTSDDFCLIFGIPSWLMPLRDRSGQSSQPFRQGTR